MPCFPPAKRRRRWASCRGRSESIDALAPSKTCKLLHEHLLTYSVVALPPPNSISRSESTVDTEDEGHHDAVPFSGSSSMICRPAFANVFPAPNCIASRSYALCEVVLLRHRALEIQLQLPAQLTETF